MSWVGLCALPSISLQAAHYCLFPHIYTHVTLHHHPSSLVRQCVYNPVVHYPDVDHDDEHIGYFDFDETSLPAKGVISYEPLSKLGAPLSLLKILEQSS